MPITPIEAVECEICHYLYKVGSGRYVELQGKIRIDQRGQRPDEWVKFLGSDTKPTVLCRAGDCILKFLELKDDY